jgi:PAS domain-containing protein
MAAETPSVRGPNPSYLAAPPPVPTRIVAGMSVEVRTFPSSDAAFRAFVRDALTGAGTDAPDELQRLLRVRYPMAVVRRQDEFARGANEAVWYAFRYGGATPPSIEWAGVEARATIDDQRRFVDVTEALAAIVELPREAILGHALEEFTNPADPTASADIAALWEEFSRVGLLVSTIRYNYVDGSPREVAFRLAADEDGPGLHRLLVHEVGSRD